MTQKLFLWRLLVLTAPLALAGCIAVRTSSGSVSAPKHLNQIEGYREWTLVTKVPQDMSPAVAMLCKGPDSAQLGDNPHLPKVFRVFVNPIGTQAMLSKQPVEFPDGTIIVKEKFDRSSLQNNVNSVQGSAAEAIRTATPILMTVMVKNQGTWSYHITNADRSFQKSNSKTCINCHDKVKSQDYVFKPYVAPYDSIDKN
ncbi:MAG: cytochrome P460 family protein [Armatimonadetes bacterium]|nr:cytochrome P460 family protein [Armatimonadota bacterium]